MNFTKPENSSLLTQNETVSRTTDAPTLVPTTATITLSTPLAPPAMKSMTASLLPTTTHPSTVTLSSTSASSPETSFFTTDNPSTVTLTSILKSSSTSLTSSVSSIATMTSQKTAQTSLTSDLTSMASTSTFSPTLPSVSLNSSTSTSIPSTVTTLFTTTTMTLPNTTMPLNISDEEREAYLALLQAKTTLIMVPAMTYLIILAIVGLIGNSLVLFVYSRKFKRTPTRVFMMAMAMFDLVTNVVVIPGEIYDMFHVWDFNLPHVCGLRLFFNAFTTMASAMVLVTVAVVRYLKICRPFGKQVTIKQAKILSVTLATTSLIFSIPYGIINGRHTRETPRPGIYGYECTIDDSYKNTIWPVVNSGFFILLFISCGIPLVIFYILIGIQAWRHSRVYGVASFSKGEGKNNTDTTDSSTSAGKRTKSTDDSIVRVSKSSKTRSYIKKKTDSETAVKAESKKDDIVAGTQEDKDDANVIELIDDAKEANESRNNNNYSSRMIRAPTGPNANINLCMVRELTVKLKAVQKENEKNKDDESQGKDDAEGNPKSTSSKHDVDDKTDSMTSEKNTKSKNASQEKLDKSGQALENNKMGEKNVQSKSASREKLDKTEEASKEPSKSEDGQESKEEGCEKVDNECKESSGKTQDGPSQGSSTTQKRVDFSTGSKENLANEKEAKPDGMDGESSEVGKEKNGGESGKDVEGGENDPTEEEMSEFAKAMKWVDITYCLKDGNKGDEQTEEAAEEEETNGRSKKGSISLSRKISRDNSFLQKHRKLRDTLSDTLSRARKNKRDREAAEAENKDRTDVDTADIVTETGIKTGNGNDSNGNKRENRTDSIKEGLPKEQPATDNNDSQNQVTLKTQKAKRKGIGRTTAMLIIISAVYIIGFLPFLGLAFFHAFAPEAFASFGFASLVVYNLFLRSYFLNSAANPIIYSLCDKNFKKECIKLIC